MSINKAIIVGNLGRSPEVSYTKTGSKIAKLSVATTDTYKDKSGSKKEVTEWHRVVVYNEALADLCEKHLNKGDKVYIEGKIATRKWVDNSNAERFTTEIILGNYDAKLDILSFKIEKKDNGGWDSPAQPNNNELDDEIPF